MSMSSKSQFPVTSGRHQASIRARRQDFMEKGAKKSQLEDEKDTSEDDDDSEED